MYLPWTRTVAPALARFFAVCSPIPSVAPVTSTDRPSMVALHAKASMPYERLQYLQTLPFSDTRFNSAPLGEFRSRTRLQGLVQRVLRRGAEQRERKASEPDGELPARRGGGGGPASRPGPHAAQGAGGWRAHRRPGSRRHRHAELSTPGCRSPPSARLARVPCLFLSSFLPSLPCPASAIPTRDQASTSGNSII